MSVTAQLVWPTAALLGEGPFWSPSTGVLTYVDIKGGAIHRYHPADNQHKSLSVEGRPSFVLPVAGRPDRLLAGSNDGLFLVDDAGGLERIATIAMPAHNRTNDATVDPQGRLWFGTMDDEEQQPTGAVHCFADGVVHRLGGEAVVTNGPAVSADGETLYHVSSGDREIWRFRIGDGPVLTDRELFQRVPDEQGYPDGIVLDSEGCLWVALWDGWGVQRYSPSGELLMRVELPCARATKIAFGGADLRTAYVTTARVGLDEAALREQPLAGGLFAFASPVAGVALPEVRL